MKSPYTRQNLIEAAITFVSYRLRSSAELRTYLAKKAKAHDLSASDIDAAFERLVELGYVDDRRFAEAFVSSRLSSKPKGRRLLAAELKSKGIDPDTAVTAIDSILADAAATASVSEHDLAVRALGKRLELWRNLPVMERRKKLYGFLMRRGFSADTVARIVDGMDQTE